MSLVYQKNGIANVIKDMGEAQVETYNDYIAEVGKYEQAADALDKYVYDNYLSPESEYRALKNAVKEALADIKNGSEAYYTAVAALEAKRAEMVEGYNDLVDAFTIEADNLTDHEYAFNQEIRSEYRAKVMDIINASLEEESTFMDKFTAEYKTAIDAANAVNESFKSKIG